MHIFSLQEVVDHARQGSPFFRELYKSLPAKISGIEQLPIIDQNKYWQANTLVNNQVLTATPTDAIVFKSGGTTGAPKFSIYTRAEWATFTEVFGQGLTAGGLRPGERIANLFYGGALYASFLFIYKSLEYAKTPSVQFPIAGAMDPADVLRIVEDFAIDTLAGVPTGILSVVQTYAARRRDFPNIKIKRILFGGESMHPDQRQLLADIFPGVRIDSIGYASVDAGLLGYADTTCGADEHRVFGDASIVEIVDDDSGTPINKVGQGGRVLITNLTRTLMPIIRYPAGDRAEWIDDPTKTKSPRFRLLGRSEEAARIGPVSLYYTDIELLLAPFKSSCAICGFQIEVYHRESMDGLLLRIAVATPDKIKSADKEAILRALFDQRPMLRDWAASQKIHAVKLEWVGPTGLSVNTRTGKLRRVIDLRFP